MTSYQNQPQEGVHGYQNDRRVPAAPNGMSRHSASVAALTQYSTPDILILQRQTGDLVQEVLLQVEVGAVTVWLRPLVLTSGILQVLTPLVLGLAALVASTPPVLLVEPTALPLVSSTTPQTTPTITVEGTVRVDMEPEPVSFAGPSRLLEWVLGTGTVALRVLQLQKQLAEALAQVSLVAVLGTLVTVAADLA